MKFKDYLTETLDHHAAVFMAHTKSKDGTDPKRHSLSISNLADTFRRHGYIGTDKLDHLHKMVKDNDLELRSSHPDALKNLRSNLLKADMQSAKNNQK